MWTQQADDSVLLSLFVILSCWLFFFKFYFIKIIQIQLSGWKGCTWHVCTQIAALEVHRISCCTALSSMVKVDRCHAMVRKRERKMRAVTSSHSEHAPFVTRNGTCLFCRPACLLCAVAKLDFQIKKPVGDEDSSFRLPFNNHPCLLFRESSLYIFFS